jgi:hypothetical protein
MEGTISPNGTVSFPPSTGWGTAETYAVGATYDQTPTGDLIYCATPPLQNATPLRHAGANRWSAQLAISLNGQQYSAVPREAFAPGTSPAFDPARYHDRTLRTFGVYIDPPAAGRVDVGRSVEAYRERIDLGPSFVPPTPSVRIGALVTVYGEYDAGCAFACRFARAAGGTDGVPANATTSGANGTAVAPDDGATAPGPAVAEPFALSGFVGRGDGAEVAEGSYGVHTGGIRCAVPPSLPAGPVAVWVSMNGQQFSPTGANLTLT